MHKVKKGKRVKNPLPPFTTSTLQQEASRKLNFITKRTMSIAQALYEGVDVKGYGTVGLITYMRTDSVRISEEAQEKAIDFIKENYGDKYIPEKLRVYKGKKNIQDAHEAIRPSHIDITPEKAKESLTPEQYKLYSLIWKRFIASQMESCVLNTNSIDIVNGKYNFKASGSNIDFDGFMKIYDYTTEDDENDVALPILEEGEVLDAASIEGKQHFTQPPARYTEASFVKLLEEKGNQLREPYSKPIDDGIFELRCKVGNNITRILYFFYYEGKIILTNGFVKKTRKTPTEEIKLAKERRSDFKERMGKV